MNMKTVEQIIADSISYKGVSLYNAILREIKTGVLAGKVIALNRNDTNAKFLLAKTSSRNGNPMKEVMNYLIIDMDAFDAWFETIKEKILTVKTINRTQVTMPYYDDVANGSYTPEQLKALALHMANNRYGKSGAPKKKTIKTGKRGRPAKAKK
jgi:hypothetical protein